MNIIPTSSKAKLPKRLSHPIGSQKISMYLQGCNFFGDLSIWFPHEEGEGMGIFTPGWMGTRYLNQDGTELLGFKVIFAISYNAHLGKWSIRAYPTSKEKSKRSREFLENIGLPFLKKWLDNPKSDTWFSGHRNIQLGLNDTVSAYCILETHNNDIIQQKKYSFGE